MAVVVVVVIVVVENIAGRRGISSGCCGSSISISVDSSSFREFGFYGVGGL